MHEMFVSKIFYNFQYIVGKNLSLTIRVRPIKIENSLSRVVALSPKAELAVYKLQEPNYANV